MMLERAVIAALLIVAGSGAYFLFKQAHMRRLQPETGRAGRPRLLYFRSDYCAPCLTQARFLEELPNRLRQRVTIEKIDVEREDETASRYGVFTLPTTLLLDDEGRIRHVNYGLADAGKLARQVEGLL